MNRGMCEREKVALQRDAAACVQNQLITQIEILCKSQSTRNQGAEGLPSHSLSSRGSPTLRAIGGALNLTSRVMMSIPRILTHKAPKVLHIEDIEEIVWRQIDEASQQLWKKAEAPLENLRLTTLGRNHFSLLPQEIRDAEL